jgi:hypothetical protein
VSRGVLVALAAVAVAGGLGTAFLIGRESTRTGPRASATPTTASSPFAAPSGKPSEAYADPSNPTLATSPAPPGSSPKVGPSEATAPIAASPPHDTSRDDVASYFREVEAIQSQAKSWSDPEALAQKLLEQAAKGDASGFDGLAAANQKVRDGLRALSVPEPCREHHRLTLTLLDESIAMLDRVKGQMNGADAGSLTAMATEGHELERKAKIVDAMAAEIKRRFGL